MSVITVENLRYRYPHTKELALDGLDFSVEKGEFIGIIGENGAGKSTLSQAIMGLVPQFYKGAYGGMVTVDGIEAGKTPVAQLCGHVGLVFQNFNLFPHFSVLKNITDTSYLIGDGTGRGSANSNYFVFESDEYQRHFMPYHPEYSIITNIDFDHPDYFKSIDDVFDAFNDYAKQVQKALFLYGDDAYLRKITSDADIYYYGFKDTDDFVAYDIVRTTNGSVFKVRHGDEELGSFHLPAFGLHNILNATAVVANLYIAGIDMELVAEHMKTFAGVKRRFTEKVINNTTIIDDFAHHPTEIIATLDAARQKYPSKEIVAIFQPHTFTRTIALLDEFTNALNQADSVYLAPIYGSAREVDHGDVKVEDLASKIQKSAKVISLENVSPLLDHDSAIYVFMGAGDIQMYERAFEELLANLANNTQ